MSALGFVAPQTLKELLRLQPILSARPLTWPSPSSSRLWLEWICESCLLTVLGFISFGNVVLWTEVVIETFCSICLLVIVEIVNFSFVPLKLFCREGILLFWRLGRDSSLFRSSFRGLRRFVHSCLLWFVFVLGILVVILDRFTHVLVLFSFLCIPLSLARTE